MAHPTNTAGLYIHVPFCTSVCPYCDFAVTIAGAHRRAAWADGVLREAAMYLDCGLEFDTVYFGGGTPSSLSAQSLSEIVAGMRKYLRIRDDAWIHLEINPEDVTPDNVAAWRDLGVRFVSLGVQSFDDDDLRFLVRQHSAAQALSATEALLGGGFDTVSIDFIYGMSGQSRKKWKEQLTRAAALGVQHLSCYQLTFHGGTLFGRRLRSGSISELSGEEQEALFFLTHEVLAGEGLPAYEVSSFAAGPEHRSRHNQKYWDFSPYLGLGPSAHSFHDGHRWWNHHKVRHWQAELDAGRLPVEDIERPSVEESVLEVLMLGLRTAEGVDLAMAERRFGFDLLGTNLEVIDRHRENGFLNLRAGRLRPTLEGLAVADSLARSFDLSMIQTGTTRNP